MSKSEFSGNPQNSSSDSIDDIPAALRDTPDTGKQMRWSPRVLLMGGLAAFFLLAVGVVWLFVIAPKNNTNSQPTPASSTSPQDNALNSNSVNTANNNDTVLGHLAYAEAPESELAPITADGKMRMRKVAAEKFKEMTQAARREGVIIVPVSAFRSVQEQNQLFFAVGAARNQTPAERAALSAPPGHSEHHTGYAVDVGDGSAPATNLQVTFENTKAYQWLQTNAAKFSFELSFPKDNPQGVSYEPWHWRFVGDRNSLETFYKARNLKPVLTTPAK
ncbi:MAG TPA: D-alanyl-D-alanine carboxypeptidase family protein [Nostocaceae cyanobacterium]|nr:D-alanyl-D-alanine carboxypeptidase family protein [Nostocaceae cyanobacterium]